MAIPKILEHERKLKNIQDFWLKVFTNQKICVIIEA